MSEYKGFKYKKLKDGRWQLVYPSGFKTVVNVVDEALLKHLIDNVIAEHSNG